MPVKGLRRNDAAMKNFRWYYKKLLILKEQTKSNPITNLIPLPETGVTHPSLLQLNSNCSW